jgi:hypothetical protein
MVCAFEYLPLFSDRTNDDLQRRSAVRVAKSARADFFDHFAQTTPDRTKVLDPLVPQKPALIGACAVQTPVFNKSMGEVGHIASSRLFDAIVALTPRSRASADSHGSVPPRSGKRVQNT